eukprot:CAMPEP_0179457628 /NCGR_PEP_ID=MMETSP0799-20121207/41372_1 /TAXON_ID=46947 /ORGANISM="Geminigera cryophila, Strain CCMP2564" /LENGTH=124 /DNA_ID=CAMNT_0021258457 /DNA_START=230 /DNA_END=604 /DNA_ORIENTATION=+
MRGKDEWLASSQPDTGRKENMMGFQVGCGLGEQRCSVARSKESREKRAIKESCARRGRHGELQGEPSTRAVNESRAKQKSLQVGICGVVGLDRDLQGLVWKEVQGGGRWVERAVWDCKESSGRL